MNEAVETVVKNQIVKLAGLLKNNPGTVLQVSEDGSCWDLNKIPLPENILDRDVGTWIEQNCIAQKGEYKMPSPGLDCQNDILIQAMALALDLKLEPY